MKFTLLIASVLLVSLVSQVACSKKETPDEPPKPSYVPEILTVKMEDGATCYVFTINGYPSLSCRR